MNKRYEFKRKGYTVYRTRSGSSPRRSRANNSIGLSISRSVTNRIARTITNWLFRK